MLNKLITAISTALYAEFGYENYIEEIRQDLNKPCFFISAVNSTVKRFVGKRYFRSNQFCIQYFPGQGEIQPECNETAERMVWCLEHIQMDGKPIQGTKMKHEIVDGILNFFINYDCFVYCGQEETFMGKMDTEAHVKGGG